MDINYYKDKLEELQKLSKTGFWELDLQTQKVLYSSEIYNILEINKDSFVHTYENFLKLVLPEDLEKINSFYINNIKNKTTNSSIKHRIITKTNTIKYLEHRLKINFNNQGVPISCFGTIQDISNQELYKQKQNEDFITIKNNSAELEAIFNNTIDGLAIIDLDTNFIKVNDSYCNITGLSKDELLKSSCFELTEDSFKDESKKSFEEFLKTNESKSFEKICRIKNRNIDVILHPYRISEDKILINMRDISVDKLIQEQSRLISMGEMVENIAHQWRQPLSIITSIASSTKLLSNLNKLEKNSLSEDMDKILKQSNLISNIIDDFGNFISYTNDLEKISILDTLKTSLSLIDLSLKSNNIRVVTDFQEDLIISGYKNELIQSFVNILNNAKDALLDKNDRFILICSKKVGNNLRIEIKDSGGGIPEKIINRVFEPYFTTKHQSFGTGIGLSMTHKFLATRHNATITQSNIEFEFKHKIHKGASFVIMFQDSPKDI